MDQLIKTPSPMCVCAQHEAPDLGLTGFLLEKHTLQHDVLFEHLKDTPRGTDKPGYPVWTLKTSQIFKHSKDHTKKVIESDCYPVGRYFFLSIVL